jgi:hypothetical protein
MGYPLLGRRGRLARRGAAAACAPRLACAAAAAGAAAVLASLAFAGGAIADTPPGHFVIGDQNAAVGSTVTFWGAQWWKDNPLSTGFAPPSFKGFADTSTATCGENWTTEPGNSSDPPATLDSQIEVVVSDAITKTGPVISGDTTEVVLVNVDLGYAGNPGHPGTGTVVGIVCGGPSSGPPT